MIQAELVDGCNLRCALCINRDRKMSMDQMSMATVEKIVKKYGDQRIDWFNWGEPLLHRDFVEISKILESTRSRMSTNLSLYLSDEMLDALCRFSEVIVSISGMTPEIYNIYHCGGKFDLVMLNLWKLSLHRRKRIIINWLRHECNEFQYEDAKKYCEKLGFIFCSVNLNCTVEECIEGFDSDLIKHNKYPLDSRNTCKIMRWTPISTAGEYLLCCASENVKLGYTIDDDISPEELMKAKMNTQICKVCNERKLWRMFN